MKCVAIRAGQTRVDGKIKFFNEGEVGDFEVCPTNFRSLEEEYEVDFFRASEQELLDSTWKSADAAAAMQTLFGAKLKLEKGVTTKEDVVAQILDLRFRNADTNHLQQN